MGYLLFLETSRPGHRGRGVWHCGGFVSALAPGQGPGLILLILSELWLLYQERPLEDSVRQLVEASEAFIPGSDTYRLFFVVLTTMVNTSTGVSRALVWIEFRPSDIPVLPS